MGKGREVPDILVNLMLSLLQKIEVNRIYKKSGVKRGQIKEKKNEKEKREKRHAMKQS